MVATLDELDEAALISILTEPKNALTKQYRRLFDMEGAELEFREEALRAVAHRAMQRKTGARGLRTILENVLLDTMYELPSHAERRARSWSTRPVIEGADQALRGLPVATTTSRAAPSVRSTEPPRARLGTQRSLRRLSRRVTRVETRAAQPHFPLHYVTAIGRGSHLAVSHAFSEGFSVSESPLRHSERPTRIESVPVLPLRDVVVYPHMVIPLFVGREKSIQALDVAMRADKRIMLVAQKQADVDDPEGRRPVPHRHRRHDPAAAQTARRHRQGAGRRRRSRAHRAAARRRALLRRRRRCMPDVEAYDETRDGRARRARSSRSSSST